MGILFMGPESETASTHIYDYRESALWKIYLFLSILVLAWVGLGLIFLTGLAIDRNYIYPAALCLILAVFFLWGLTRFHLWHLPLSVSTSGLTTWLFNREHVFIAWRDVRKIEKVYFFNTLLASYNVIYRIYGTGNSIRFDNRLKDLRVLLNVMNIYIHQHKINVIFYDRGEETIRRIDRTVVEPAERKKMLWQGVVTHLSEL